MHLITDMLIRDAVNVILTHKYGREMSIGLPNNKAEKLARYNMLAKQGSLSYKQAKQAYRDYLRRRKLY